MMLFWWIYVWFFLERIFVNLYIFFKIYKLYINLKKDNNKCIIIEMLLEVFFFLKDCNKLIFDNVGGGG